MNQSLQNILNILHQSEHLSVEEKNALIKAVKDTDKEIAITEFKLDRTEKVKRTTAILLEETIAELEQKRKAVEEQNKELEIEAALEKVRSRSLAMHSSDEMQAVVNTVIDQLQKLNIVLDTTNILIFNKQEKFIEFWTGSNSTGDQLTTGWRVPYFNISYYKAIHQAHENGKEIFTGNYSFTEKNKLFKHLFANTDFKNLNPERKKFILKSPRATIVAAITKDTAIQVISYTRESFSGNEIEILKRFSKVFNQAYTRFLDLQKSEAQAREAQIEAALEKVRSRSLAMHKSDELKEVIKVVLEQFIHLKINAEHAGFYIDYKAQDDMHIWLADPNLEPFFAIIPYFDTPTWNSFLDAKAKGIPLHTDLLNFEEKNKFYQSLFKLFTIPEEAKQFYMQCKGLAVSTALLDNVGLYIENFSAIPYTDEENKILIRFGKVFQQTYIRFLDLQKAEAQAREAQIETALERVRSRSMAMHASKELKDVAKEMRNQFGLVGQKELETCAIHLWDQSSGQLEAWAALRNPDNTGDIIESETRFDIKGIRILEESFQNYLSGKKDYVIISDAVRAKEFFEAIKKIDPKAYDFLANRTKNIKSDGITAYWSVSDFRGGSLVMVTINPPDENSRTLLQRFAIVFGQAYQRFFDLKKAEAQAREAQIETALERVRSRTMSMQKSSELLPTAEIMFDQLKLLGAELQGVAFAICDENCTMVQKWTSIGNFSHPYDIEPGEQRMYEAWKNQSGMYEEVYEGEKQKKYYELFMEIPEFRQGLQKVIDMGFPIPTWQKNYAVPFKNGYVLFIITQPFNETQIFLRFGKVFEQTYTRFLDLQNAELQARESKIEASLEKVRTVALTMKKSDEMLDIARSLYEQLLELGFSNIRNAIIDLHNDKTQTFLDYDYSHKMGGTVTLMSYYEDPIIEKQVRQIISASDAFFELILEGQELQDLIDIRLKNGEEEDYRLREIDMLTYNLYSFGNGAIGISNFGLLSDEQKKVLKRFRNVFAFAYKRYTDMVQAETQAREAQVEAALERVRSRTLGMQRSEELAETSAILFQQLILLGIEPNRLYISIVKDEKGDAEFWITDEDGSKVSMAYQDNLFNNTTFKKMFDGWAKQEKSQVIDMKGEELQLYFTYLNSIHVPFKGGLEQKRRLQYIAYFNNGFIGMASPDEQPEDTLQLLERFAGVFNLTFTRFNDLKQAEVHALQAEQDLIEIKSARKKAEEALTELQATQAQLIQSEKMASLGELTAGIAHEIQNPLNFVNNFSEVSTELVDEMNEEITKGNLEDAKEIANDLKQNLEKINHHGKRAGDIVKGMLQHSRTSTGQKELTDINALCDEYLRLSYHGLRAKDKTFNAEFKTDFDSSLPKINVVPQDIGRVILNLINNAFYACTERSRSTVNEKKTLRQADGESYEPTVTVSTKRNTDKVEIKVADNGNGIPKNIIDKIFQPFFTTKPTGSGTGLGLSLSYDIVKAHGGEIKVETKEKEGTEFLIQLPVV